MPPSARSRPQPAAALTWRQVMTWRVQRHHLHHRVPHDAMLDVVGQLGGVQAQVMSAAELALWARVDGLERDAVARALWEERGLVKTWAMRGTLHLLPAAELQLWQRVLNLDRRYLRPAWLRYFEITADELERLIVAVAAALDGKVLTREELVNEVATLVGSDELAGKLRHSWGTMLKPAAFRGQLCFAPGSGQNVRFTHPASWLGSRQPIADGEAEHTVTRRFLATYGPVTRDVFAQWLGASRSRTNALIAALGDDAAPVDVEGTPAWALTEHLEGIASAASQSVRLLPAFDQYVLAASRDAEKLLPGPFRNRIYRPQGWLTPVLLVNGRMDGVWSYQRKGSRLLVEIEPFVAVADRVQRAAEEEADRLAAFLGGKLELAWVESQGSGRTAR